MSSSGRLAQCALLWGVLLLLAGPGSSGPDKMNSSLKFLKELKNRHGNVERLSKDIRTVVSAPEVVLTIQYDHVLTAAEITDLEARGMSFFYLNGEVARTRAIYPVRMAWPLVDEISARTEVLRMESAWRPAVFPPLDVARPEVEADSAQYYSDPLGFPLTGKGVRIADFDTGIDIFNPAFFFADGDTVEWLDVDISGDFTPGTDAVDMNGNDLADADETLRFTDGWISDYANLFGPDSRSNDDDIYQTYWDWLYADLNNDGSRQFGPASFTDSDPTFGEPVFIVLDTDENGELDVGEQLVGLGTSKVVTTINSGLVERLRGIDLIHSELDGFGHGTPVSGVLAGCTAGRHRFAGIAPEAELITGNFFSGALISYLVPWARSHGADVMLHEYSAFIFEFLDGSSLDELLISAEHQDIVQVVPSGNLGSGDKHAAVLMGPGATVYLLFDVPYSVITTVFNTTRWLPDEPSDLTFHFRTPSGTEVELVDSVTYVENFYVWHNRDISPRGTHKMDLVLEPNTNPDLVGRWVLVVTNNAAFSIRIFSDVADDVTSWSGGTEFFNYTTKNSNVTFPATADSALVNGSYSTRGFESSYGIGGGTISPGEISAFSGRGGRPDGFAPVDICAPGNYDVFAARSHEDALHYPVGSYQQFSGTSAAGPFVAAAAALMRQAYPYIRPWQIEQMLKDGAAVDAFTGTVPNSIWGGGKLRILNALKVASGVMDIVDGRTPPSLQLDQNYPNPFNPTTWIPFYLPEDGRASLKVYNVRGEVVRVLRDRWYHQGPHSVRWDGRDGRQRDVATGIYFCVLKQAGERQVRKMVLVR
jgi:subtilisin family serine protease